MGTLYQVLKLRFDPTDTYHPYTPYTFVDSQMTMDLGIGRRESVVSLPRSDNTIDGYGTAAGPLDKRYFSWGFRVVTQRGPDAAHDLLMAAVMGNEDVRLVYRTDVKDLRYTTGTLVKVEEVRTIDQNWFVDFKVTWRIRPDWRLQFSEVSDVWQVDTEVFAADDSEVFPTDGTTTIATATQAFTLDSRGTAGVNMATIDDTGPIIYIVGPAGGDGGMVVTNYSSFAIDKSNNPKEIFFSFPFKLLNSADSVLLNFTTQSFWHNGVPFRPYKPDYQGDVFFRVERNTLNTCTVSGLASVANPTILTGGNITVDWWRKFA